MPTVITISEFQIPECNFKGTTCKLRRYYDSEWTDIDGVLHEPGSIGSSTDFFDEIDCTLEDNTITVPAFDASPSINARIGSPRETWQLWDQAGSARNVIAENWFIPSSPTTTTRDALAIANQGQSLQNPIATYLNALQVQQLIDAVIGALRFATSVIAGWVRLSVPAVSAVDPIAVGDNDPRVIADQAANIASIRTLGAGPLQAAEGNDPRIPSAGAYYYALNYSSFAAAVTAMGTTVPVRLIVSEQMAVAGSVPVTPNIQLEFVGNGKLIVGAGATVTIQGPLIIPPGKQVFDTTAIGSAVTVTGDTYALSGDAPNFTIYSHNYVSFNLAEAAIEALGGGTLVVDDLSQVSATIVVPSNVSIVFSGAGVLGALSGGKTVTFQGPFTAPPWFIFSSVLTISFSGNTFVTAYYPQWWGVIGDGATDDTAALQAFTDQIPSQGAHVIFTSNLKIKITNTWLISNKKAWCIEGLNSNGPTVAPIGNGMPAILWYGANGGTVIDMSHSNSSRFRSFGVQLNVTGTDADGADVGMLIEQDGGGDVSTSLVFEYMYLWSNSVRSNVRLVSIGGSSGNNNEFIEFNHSTFVANNSPDINSGLFGNSVCIDLAGSFNTKGIKLHKNTYSQAHIGIRCHRGSFNDDGAEGGTLEIAYDIEENSDSIFIRNGVLENVRQPLVITAPNNPVTAIGNNWENGGVTDIGQTYPVIDFQNGASTLTLIGNSLGDLGFGSRSVTKVYAGSAQNTLILMGNLTGSVNPEILQRNYATFGITVIDGHIISSSLTPSTNTASQEFIESSGLQRQGLTLQNLPPNSFRRTAGVNNLYLADGALEVFGLANNNLAPRFKVIGTPGSTQYDIAIVSLDAAGNKTMRTPRTDTRNANATLSASNRIELDWLEDPKALGGYDIINSSGGDNGPWQLVAHVASGVITYNVVANPAGAFTYVLPTYNETMTAGTRGAQFAVNIIPFADGATTPSVKQSNIFKTVNSAPTTITNFTQAVDGTLITVIMRDANTTIANNGTINTRSGADIVPANNRSYSFVREGGVWVQVN